jgi:predicted amidohydrolase YtcJ
VKIEEWTGHGTTLNTAAMELLDIGEQEPDPMGGHYDRVPGTQILTGEAHEYAEHMIRRKLFAMMSNAQAVSHYESFASDALALGFTSVQDMAVGMPHPRAVAILEAADLPIRVRSICFPLSVGETCEFLPVNSNDSCDSHKHEHGDHSRLTASGIKWVTDGTPIERYAFLEAPYADSPDTSGQFNFPTYPFLGILLRGRVGKAQKHQTHFHAVGDGAVDRVLDGLDATGGHHVWANRRTRIEHGDLLFEPNVDRMLDLGVTIVQNPTHLALTPVWNERFTPAIVEEMEPLQTLLDVGIPLAFGTDGIGRAQSPWVDIFFAATHPTRPSEAISVEDAVTAYTAGAAYAEFEEDDKGTLTPGKLADLAVLSQDVFSVPVFALPATMSVLTMVGGKIAWSSGAL